MRWLKITLFNFVLATILGTAMRLVLLTATASPVDKLLFYLAFGIYVLLMIATGFISNMLPIWVEGGFWTANGERLVSLVCWGGFSLMIIIPEIYTIIGGVQ